VQAKTLLKLSVVAAVATIAMKTGAWWITGSVGLLSDAMESFVNLASALFAVLMVTIAERPADEDHPFGHSKAEYFSSGFEGLLIVGAAVAIIWAAAGRFANPQPLEQLGWGVALVGVLGIALRNRMLLFNAAAMSALATALLDLLPIDPFIHPMPPVLSGTPWLAIHVPIIMIGYACLAIVTLFGHLVVGAEIFAPARRDLATRWSEMLYWYTHVGSILLLTGILTGSIWAASSWGRYWGWDPKEVWSLVAFLAYMAILHARSDGQIQSFAVAAWSIAAFWTILMTYLGVNFVLASGLHSYGFGSSNLVRIMLIVALVEAVFLTAGVLAHRRRLAGTPDLA